MNSSKKPLIAALVFTLGIALGLGWKLGLIPVQYGPAPSGTLEQSDQTAAEDTAGSVSGAPLADTEEAAAPDWTAEQAEPPVEEGVNQKVAHADSEDEPQRRHADGEVELVPAFRRNLPSPRPRVGGEGQPEGASASVDSPSVTATPPAFQRNMTARFKSKQHDKTRSLRGSVQPAQYQIAEDNETESSEPKPVETSADEPADRFAAIDAKLSAGELLAAHKEMSKMFWKLKSPDAELQSRLETTAKKIFFSPQPHFIEPHVVQSGDQLQKVAKKYNLSWEYLAALNKTDPRRIREGQKLKVLKGPFAAIISLRDFSLTVHLQGYYVKRYQVGIGKDGTSPIGKFPVLGKLVDPQYTDPDGNVIEGNDPANPLGKRWIDLGDSYGIHGTIEPDSIGQAESRGCIRLRDADIIEVYNFLVPGSTVEIRE